jgi:transcriptional regulator with PAS, ATPase and Fis domain
VDACVGTSVGAGAATVERLQLKRASVTVINPAIRLSLAFMMSSEFTFDSIAVKFKFLFYNHKTIHHFEVNMKYEWEKEMRAAITVCDPEGIILYMNEQSMEVFQKSGGKDLIGKNLLDCHPDPSRSKLVDLLQSPRVNAYTIEKNGKKKMIYQTPWYSDGKYSGLVEISLPLPEELPHFIRK